MADNPSVVNDASGNNYTLGMGGIGGEAKMQYLENLAQLAQKMPPKPLSNDQYFPGAGGGIQAGSYSGSVVGHVPIYAAGGGLFPFAMIDEMQRAKADAEAEYYKKLKLELDKPLYDLKLKLSDPFKQPAFSNKIQNTIDTVLDKYASRFGGDYSKAYIATMHDKYFRRTMQGFQQYADMFELVNKKALQIIEDDKTGKYVSPAIKKAVNGFIGSIDALEDLPPAKLLEQAQNFKSIMGVTALADAATSGIKNTVVEDYDRQPSKTMSTDELDTWVKRSYTNKGLVDKLYNSILEANPEYKEDETQKSLLKAELEARIDHSVGEAVTTIKKNNADRTIALAKRGIKLDENGNIILSTKPAAVVANAIGTNAISYPVETNPIPSAVGMNVYIRKDGMLRRVKLPDSYNMKPMSEYDIGENNGVARGRYVEAMINFQSTAAYSSDIYRNIKQMPVDVGDTKGTTQVFPAKLEDLDRVGEYVEMIGPTTIITPYENLKSVIEANVPYMGFVHDKLDEQTYPSGKRRTYGLSNELPESPIPITDDMNMNNIYPDKMYIKNDKVISGKELWDKYQKAYNKK